MKPTLFHLFGEPIPAYFTMLLLGFGLAIFLGARASKRSGFDPDVFIDLGLYCLIAGVVGGRIMHVIADGYFWDYVYVCLDPSKVAWEITRAECPGRGGVWDAAASVCRPAERNCFAWAEFWAGGLAYYGGLIAALGFSLWFLRRERFPMIKAFDLAGMVIPLGLFFGRMGCFLGGCCFGQPHDGAFSLRFPAWSPASRAQWKADLLPGPDHPSLPVHPTQLYEAGGSLLIAAALMLIVRPRKRFDGEVMLIFLISYSVLRFGLEYLRADDRGELLGLSSSQLVSLVIVAAVGWVWIRLRRHADEVKKAALASHLANEER